LLTFENLGVFQNISKPLLEKGGKLEQNLST